MRRVTLVRVSHHMGVGAHLNNLPVVRYCVSRHWAKNVAIPVSNFKHCIFGADNFVTLPSKRKNIIQSQTLWSKLCPGIGVFNNQHAVRKMRFKKQQLQLHCNYIANFVGFKAVYFGRKFWKTCPKKGGGHLQSKKFHCKFTQVKVYLRKKRNEIS